MKAGDRIRISAAGKGECLAVVHRVMRPEALPSIDDAPDVAIVRLYFQEAGVDALMYLSYLPAPGGPELSMFALHKNRRWYDLQGQQLTLTPACSHAAS